uniref:CSON008949 protein n=1 Tax=Culicoides sonorensis TaxID=179676 RepID=A0A336M227_CULSO
MEIKFKALIRNLLYKCKDEAVLSNERKTKLKLIDLGVLKLLGNCLTLNWDFMNRKDSMNMVSKKSSNDKHILIFSSLSIFLVANLIINYYHFIECNFKLIKSRKKNIFFVYLLLNTSRFSFFLGENIWDLFIFLFIRVILILYQIHFTQHYDDDES